MKSKKELRREILQRRDALDAEERKIKSAQITEQICQMKEFIEADKVLLFASYKSEVDTTEIFKAAQRLRKDIFYPKVIGKEMEFYKIKTKADLIEGYRGILEPEANPAQKFVPITKEKICILMPGAVFDSEGNRIGYGGGYYDKFLYQLETIMKNEDATPSQQICKMAVAFQCQIVDVGSIICQDHDIKVDYIVTEQQLYECC